MKKINPQTVLRNVRREFGCSFRDVVVALAEKGYSQRLAADHIGISRPTLRKYCVRFNLLGHFKPHGDQVDICRGKGSGKDYRCGPGKKHDSAYFWNAIQEAEDSNDLNLRFGISRVTIKNYLGKNWSEVKDLCLSPAFNRKDYDHVWSR